MWATDAIYICAGVRVRVRCTSADFGARVAALLGRCAAAGGDPADPAASDLTYSLVAGAPPSRAGRRNYHFLYREIMRQARTMSPPALIGALADDLAAVLPHFRPDLYALRAGMVARGENIVLLLGETPAATRRLAATLTAHGYAYAGPLLFVDPAARTWSPLPLPLADSDDGGEPALVENARSQEPPNTTGAAVQDRPLGAGFVRALVVEVVTTGDAEGSGGETAMSPIGRARAVLSLVRHSANSFDRPDERPALARDLLDGAACFELRRPATAGAPGDGDDRAVAAIARALA